MNFDNEQKEKIEKYVHEDFPLGPINAETIDDPYVSDVLFEEHNKLYDRITERPSIVLGRRGSGKTSFLQHLQYGDKYKVAVLIDTSDAFTKIIRSVQATIESDGFIFPEDVAKLWHALFWVEISYQIQKIFPKRASKFETFEKLFEIFDLKADMRPSAIIQTVLRVLKNRSEDGNLGMAADVFFHLLDERGTSFEEIKDSCQSVLDEEKSRAIILLDSLESFELDIQPIQKAMEGLFKAIGEFNVVRGRPEIRFCLPSELYYVFVKLSKNRVKDFSQRMLLHWHSGELLTLAAHRYKVYLNVHSIGSDSVRHSLNIIDVSDRRGAIKFFELVFPDYIRNNAGVNEKPLPYLLRHTQLLPRHILRYLTAIIKIDSKSGNGGATSISESAIKQGIAAVEGELWREVCDAFSYRYPEALEVCSAVVPELPLRFSNGELHSVFNRVAKGVYTDSSIEFSDFKRMLVEIGCIGAVVNKSGIYIRGAFEYIMPETLDPAENNELCLHPMFCGGMKNETPVKDGTDKFVYPFGTDPEDQDYRDD